VSKKLITYLILIDINVDETNIKLLFLENNYINKQYIFITLNYYKNVNYWT